MRLFIIILLFFTSCEKKSVNTAHITKTAIIYSNNLPADGCDERIVITDITAEKQSEIQTLLPTEETKQLFKDFIAAQLKLLPAGTYEGSLRVPVQLTYETTTQTGVLQCGWGKTSKVDLIKLISIEKK